MSRGPTASSRHHRVLVGIMTVLALAACTDDGSGGETSATSSPGSGSATPSAPPEPPRAGECRRLTFEEATAATSDAAAVPCDRRHTAVTVHVGRLSRLVPGASGTVDVEGERVQRRVAEECEPRLGAFLGGDGETLTLSRFQVVWFTPTPEEHEAGADWFRCDLLALDQDDRLMSLPPPARLEGVLDRPDALATYGLCGTAAPGERGFERVACARRHSWVAIGTITLEGGARYPGPAAVREAGDEPCADRVREERGFPVEFEYGWEWPTAAQWEAGQRHGICWAPA